MGIACGDRDDPAIEPIDTHGRMAIDGRPIAELAGMVPSPALDSTRDGEGAGVRAANRCTSCGDSGDGTAESHYFDGGCAIGGRAVAELSAAVAAPARNGSGTRDDAAMCAAAIEFN